MKPKRKELYIMKTKKLFLLLLVSLFVLILTPISSFADSTSVEDEENFKNAIQNAANGDSISLAADIKLTAPIEITDKNIAINGNGHTISAESSNWNPNGANSTLLTAGAGAKLNLVNLKLANSPKYGVQAYNGGYVILDNVTISDCAYGGVLVNAGTVEVKKLDLGHNGKENSNNGIELAKSSALSESENRPTLKMNGTISSNQTENVIYVDIDDPSTSIEIINSDDSENKIFLNDNKLVVADKENKILFESSEIEGIDIDSENYVENITLTIMLNDKTETISLTPGTTLKKEDLISKIDLEKLGLNNYTIDGFYLDAEFTAEFDFETAITENKTIYAKLTEKEKEKDETPKTGTDNLLDIAIFTLIVSIVSLTLLNRKDY